MSKIDPEVLYLILTKVAGGGAFYNYDPSTLPSTQPKGTITHRHLGEVYERITGNRVGTRINWNQPLDQLNALLSQCRLPSLSPLLLTSAEAGAVTSAPYAADIKAVQATAWPAFSALKSLYRRT
jgi:hypothetical protein